jgi:hypothetical protein
MCSNAQSPVRKGFSRTPPAHSRTPSVLQGQPHERARGQRWRCGEKGSKLASRWVVMCVCEKEREDVAVRSLSLYQQCSLAYIMARGRQACFSFLHSQPDSQWPAYSLVLGSPPTSGQLSTQLARSPFRFPSIAAWLIALLRRSPIRPRDNECSGCVRDRVTINCGVDERDMSTVCGFTGASSCRARASRAQHT